MVMFSVFKEQRFLTLFGLPLRESEDSRVPSPQGKKKMYTPLPTIQNCTDNFRDSEYFPEASLWSIWGLNMCKLEVVVVGNRCINGLESKAWNRG